MPVMEKQSGGVEFRQSPNRKLPPGFCGALVGPMASLSTGRNCCVICKAISVLGLCESDFALPGVTAAKLASAATATAPKRRCVIVYPL